jgi:hypothetical protein
MMQRGVTRPMARQAVDEELEQAQQRPEQDTPGRMDRLRAHQRQVLWIPWTLVLLGVWQLLAPLTLGYGNEQLWATPSGGRGVWFSDELMTPLRASLMTWSDVATGVLLIVFGWRALKTDRPIACGAPASSASGSCSRRSCCGRRPRPASSTTASWGCSSSR